MKPHYRVAIFGSARLKQEDPEYIDFINRVHSDRFKMEHVCVNYSKYRQDLSFARFLEE
ncbi:hypothetical protein [Fischerella thermalis]|uniref:hypothetical protein n=1 Tax=Fischerella thermalis TaxID=372787 RepID=UPI0015E12454|nr:hypothetical protein [Fischerella thermalis]